MSDAMDVLHEIVSKAFPRRETHSNNMSMFIDFGIHNHYITISKGIIYVCGKRLELNNPDADPVIWLKNVIKLKREELLTPDSIRELEILDGK